MNARVFVVQNSQYRDRDSGQLVNKYDLKPAERFGKLVTVLGTGKILPERTGQAMRQMREVLSNFSDNDFILVIGDPAAIAGACMVAAEVNNGCVNLLRWDRATNTYEIVTLNTEE